MRSFIKRGIAWILIGVMLFSLVPMNSTNAREKAVAENGVISTEDTIINNEDDSNIVDDENTKDEEADTSQDVTETQESTTANVEQEGSDGSAETENGTTENNTVDKEGTATIPDEETTEVQGELEGQTDSMGKDSDEDTTVSLGDVLNPLADEESKAYEVESILVKINGKVVNPGDAPQDVKHGSAVAIRFNYKILNTANLKVNEHCSYKLTLSGVTISGSGTIVDSGKHDIGEWSYTKGNLEFWFTDEEFLKNNITGQIDLEGTINLLDVDLDDDGSGQIRIDDKFYNIHVDEEDCPVEIETTKEISSVEYHNDRSGISATGTYTVTVKALKATDNVKFWDQLGGSNSGEQGYIIITSQPKAESTPNRNTANTIVWDEPNYVGTSGFSGTIPHMEQGETITIKYDVWASYDLYKEGYSEIKANNKFTAMDRFGNSPEDKNVPFPEYSVTVEKSGEYDATTGTVRWTIVVSNPDGIDLEGVRVTDNYTGKYGDYYTDESKQAHAVTIGVRQGNNGITILETLEYPVWEFMQGHYYTFPSNSTEKEYVIQYTLEIKDEYKNSVNGTDSNRVTILNQKNGMTTSDDAEVGIGPIIPSVEKKGELIAGTNEIEWTINFTVVSDGLKNFTIFDEYDETMEYVADSVEINGPGNTLYPDSGYVFEPNPTRKVSSGKKAFEIQFTGEDGLNKGDYTITYRTTYDKDQNIKIYRNQATPIVGNNKGNPVIANVSRMTGLDKRPDTGSNTETTTSFTTSSYGTTVQTWWIQIKDFKNLTGNNYHIEDTWTSATGDEYEYIVGSMRASGTTNYDSEDAFSIEGVQPTGNGIRFEITKATLERAQSWDKLYIIYQTKIKNEDAFLNNYQDGVAPGSQPNSQITNTAVLYEGDDPIYVSPDVTVRSYPRAVVDKMGKYDQNTAPYVEYTISVNPGGNDLLKNGDTLVVKDTLPKNFVLVEDSVQVYRTNIKNTQLERVTNSQLTTPLEQDKWSYTYDGMTLLEITIPDQTEVIIKYKVIIQMPKGTDLSEIDTTNSVELSGVSLVSSKDSYSIEGQVLSSKAIARATTAKLTIYKVDALNNKKKLSGAEFQLRIVDYDSATGKVTDAKDTPQGYVAPQPFMTKEDGSYTVEDLYFDHLYELVETKAPAGYITDQEPRYFVFIGHDSDFGQVDVNKQYPEGTEFFELDSAKLEPIENREAGRVAFSKQEVGGARELPGATIVLCDETGSEVTRWVSSEEAKIFAVSDETDVKNGKLKAGKYTMKEIAAPDGYYFAEDITFTLSEDGKITVLGGKGEVEQDGAKLIMRDDVIGDVYISKKAINGDAELAGAHIVLKEKETGKVVAEWNTTSEVKKLPGSIFKAGYEYVLTETVAPEGYEVTADIIFTVDRINGGVLLSSANVNKDVETGHYTGTSGDKKNHIIIRDKKKDVTTETTTEETTTEETTTEEKTTTDTSSKTGDNAPVGALASLMTFSVTSLLLWKRKKDKQAKMN